MLANSFLAEPMAPRASVDLDACVALMRTGSKTFFAASRLLPLRVRASSIALYAFCRVADDMVDGGEMGIDEAMRVLSHRLDRIYAGDPQDFVAKTVRAVGGLRVAMQSLADLRADDAQRRADQEGG